MEEENDLGNQKQSTKVDSFEFFPPQHEVEKLLNELEKDDQILLLRSLGVREITIQEVISSASNNNNNQKQAFSTFLKEYDFFQTKEQTFSCIRRIYHAQHQNQQEIPLKFFNALTIDRFTHKLKLDQSKSQIEKLCIHFNFENDWNFKFLSTATHFQSLDNIRQFDELLSQLKDFNNLRTLIAEALSIYCGDKSYVSIISTKPFETNAEILGVFHHYFGKIIPSEFGLDRDEKILTSVMKWSALSTDNCGWEKDLTKFNDFGLVEIKINLDIPNSNQRKIELYENSTILKVMGKCSEWYFEKDKEKQNLLWAQLEPVVSSLLHTKMANTLSPIIEEWLKLQTDENNRNTIYAVFGIDPLKSRLRFFLTDKQVIKTMEIEEEKLKTNDNNNNSDPTRKWVLNVIRNLVLHDLKL